MRIRFWSAWLLALLLLVPGSRSAFAVLNDGEAGMNVIGQTDFVSLLAALTQGGMSNPHGVAIDTGSHRMFLADTGNNRVLVYNLNADNSLASSLASTVLGQATFLVGLPATTQNGMSAPQDVAFDATNNRLYVADTGNRRVLVFNTASITNAMNASYVLGQAGFTTATGATSQSGMRAPVALTYDAANGRLFVADSATLPTATRRVLVFNTAALASGMNAAHVIGQASFSASATAATQSGLSDPEGLSFDGTNNRLFVSDAGGNRVLVFDTTALTDGMNAATVIGQTDFTSSGAATTASGLSAPQGLDYDPSTNRLFVADTGNNRLLVYDTSFLGNGLGAINVLGQSSYTNATSAAGQSRLSGATHVAYCQCNSHLLAADSANNRLLVFEATYIPPRPLALQ